MVIEKNKKKSFPWRAGHATELLIDGRVFFPAMLAALAQAQRYILLEVYLVRSGHLMDRWITALIQAAARGVLVAVLLDGFGAAGLSKQDRQKLLKAGVRLNWFNPLRWRNLSGNLMRDHRKLLLVDGHTAYVGGFGLTDAFAEGQDGWREVTLKTLGPCVADWQRLFLSTWKQAKGRSLVLPASLPIRLIEPLAEGRVVKGQGLYLHAIKGSLIQQINNAKNHIWLATPYFVPVLKLRLALRRAAERGVQVHLLLPGPVIDHPPVRYAGQRFYTNLLKSGVNIYEYLPQFVHAKVSLCDDWVSIGSCNFDHWGLRWNLEANQEIRSKKLADEVLAWFDAARDESLWINACLWKKRSYWQRIREYFWGTLDALIQRLK
ncbi:phospholipase D-like domain-containing protein [Marinospirillum minutulum]|uniref:phospholipase D-like domain-containing protein n=1 Tax=Marinospirillum minutulum TaxID=64974 RepID=UPI000427D798|nr:phosphatidylserine/phosphatidylglycerophosphate/cardiolipin synthase family protein [Marinospirillum minutulum]